MIRPGRHFGRLLQISAFCQLCLCPLPKGGSFDENGENDEREFYPVTEGLCSSDPMRVEENGGCHVGKTHGLPKAWFLLPEVESAKMP